MASSKTASSYAFESDQQPPVSPGHHVHMVDAVYSTASMPLHSYVAEEAQTIEVQGPEYRSLVPLLKPPRFAV